jgi:hypothetical protein
LSNADGDRHPTQQFSGCAPEHFPAHYGRSDVFSNYLSFGQFDIGQNDRELLAPDSRCKTVSVESLFESRPKQSQHVIAHRMTVGIIELFEAINIYRAPRKTPLAKPPRI